MKIRRLFVAALVTFAMPLAANADVINIDLGLDGGATTAVGFNNITDTTVASVLNSPNAAPNSTGNTLSLVDNTGAGSSFTALLTADNIVQDGLPIATGNFATAATFAPFASAFSGTIAQSAFEDGLFLRDEDGDEFITVTLGGFTASDLVDIRLFGSRNSNGLETIVTAAGATSATGSLFTNPTVPADFSPLLLFNGFTADANGEISLTINAPGTTQSGTVNFIQFEVSSIPEPSSALVLSLSCIALVRRRR